LFSVTGGAPSGYSFSEDMPGRFPWVRVEGGGLPLPIDISTGWAPDGRQVVCGLRIGGESGTEADEITPNVLRQIKLGEIIAAFFDYFEPAWEMEDALAELSVPPRPASRGPDDADLREFARMYRTELARQPHRAMTAAAEARNISRATANRWAATCRQLGYLPSGEES
jgi:hypothetical protein